VGLNGGGGRSAAQGLCRRRRRLLRDRHGPQQGPGRAARRRGPIHPRRHCHPHRGDAIYVRQAHPPRARSPLAHSNENPAVRREGSNRQHLKARVRRWAAQPPVVLQDW
jgi:hypothetical protein